MRREPSIRRGISARGGFVLIDVILGVAIFAIVAAGFTTLLSQCFMTVGGLRDRERELAAASQQLERMAASWGAADFEVRLGTSRLGAFETTVSRAGLNLYDVRIADSTGAFTLLATTMYAADTANAVR